MVTKTLCVTFAFVAGAATALPLHAAPDQPARPLQQRIADAGADRFHQAQLRGHVRIHLATGKREVTLFNNGTGPTQRFGPSMYQNTDIAGSFSYFFDLDNPDLNPPYLNYEGLDWGDFSDFQGVTPCVDGFTFAYAGDVRMGIDPQGDGVPGLDAIIRFYNNDNGSNAPLATLLQEITITALPGHDGNTTPPQGSTYQGWTITIDLSGTEAAFDVHGDDLDFDGLRDISWSYQFSQQQPGGPGIIGPFLVQPASLGGQGNATGVEDVYDEFVTGPRQGYTGTWWFGGGGNPDPQNPGGYLPYASFFIELFGDIDNPCPAVTPCYPDCNEDGVLNINDFLCFIDEFAVESPYADCNNDGAFNINDFLCFIDEFATGCP